MHLNTIDLQQAVCGSSTDETAACIDGFTPLGLFVWRRGERQVRRGTRDGREKGHERRDLWGIRTEFMNIDLYK